MGSANGSRSQRPSRPMKREIEADPNPNPERTLVTIPDLVDGKSSASAASIDGAEEDEALRGAEFLSREEVVRRRLRRLNQLGECFQNLYWGLAEEVRVKHRDYYWEYGKSPLVEEEDGGGRIDNGAPLPEATGEGVVENGRGLGLGFGAEEDGAFRSGERPRCVFSGCKSHSMPLTRYCHAHILLDTKQTLYKGCSFVIKSTQTGQITCGKPVLRATVPILCPAHFLKAQKHISQALKKAGLSSSNRPAPKFHVIVAEYVRQIKAKRTEASRSKALTIVDDKAEKNS